VLADSAMMRTRNARTPLAGAPPAAAFVVLVRRCYVLKDARGLARLAAV
jgi:hypothetical protein